MVADPGRQVDVCLFAAHVLGSCFASSMTNPARPSDYPERTLRGLYPQEIWPGISALHLNTTNRQAPRPLHLMQAVLFVVSTLLQNAALCGTQDGTPYGLACLAPLALGLHVARVCRSTTHCFELRLLRVDALRVCKRYAEASQELATLVQGLGLPCDKEGVPDVSSDVSSGGSLDGSLLARAVAGRPGKHAGKSTQLGHDEHRETPAAAAPPTSARDTARTGHHTARSEGAEKVPSGPYDGSSSTWVEMPFIEGTCGVDGGGGVYVLPVFLTFPPFCCLFLQPTRTN